MAKDPVCGMMMDARVVYVYEPSLAPVLLKHVGAAEHARAIIT